MACVFVAGVGPTKRTGADNATEFASFNQSNLCACFDQMERNGRANNAAADDDNLFLCHALLPAIAIFQPNLWEC